MNTEGNIEAVADEVGAALDDRCQIFHILPWPRLMVWRITGAVT